MNSMKAERQRYLQMSRWHDHGAVNGAWHRHGAPPPRKAEGELEVMKEELENVQQIIEEKEQYRNMLGQIYNEGLIK